MQSETRFAPTHWAKLAQVAEVYGVSEKTIKQWRNEGMPGSPQKWPVAEIVQWRRARDLRNAENRKTGKEMEPRENPLSALQQQKLMAEIEVERERRTKLSRENAEAEGQLLAVDLVRRDIAAWAVWLRTQLLQIPASLAPIVPEEIRSSVRRSVEHKIRLALDAALRRQVTDVDLDAMILSEAKRLEEK